MPHPLAPHSLTRYLNAALVTDDSLEARFLVLSAVAFVILGRSKNPLVKETVFFGLERAVVDRLGLGNFPIRPVLHHLGRSDRDAQRIELAKSFQGARHFLPP